MIGVIADDVTGATDVAAALRRAGLRTLLALQPEVDGDADDVDAIVIGLKTRSIPVADAIEQSLAALAALQQQGIDQCYLKYCSTFDSTSEGNIGPVTEALRDALAVPLVVTTPAAPVHGRTVYRGHLFVGDALLHETHMRDHPITPMRDSSVPRLLSAQVQGGVGLVPLEVVRAGHEALSDAIEAAAGEGKAHVVVDATIEADLDAVAAAVSNAVLVAGSAGLLGALARRQASTSSTPDGPPPGATVVIAGSCSQRTLEQVERFRAAGRPAHRILAAPGATVDELADEAIAWWHEQPNGTSSLLYSSSDSSERDERIPDAGALYEATAARIAVQLAERGVQRMLVAGGETSGAIVDALGVRTAVVGPEAAVGAPWISDPERELHLVLKSGNFGAPEFFVDVASEGDAVVEHAPSEREQQ